MQKESRWAAESWRWRKKSSAVKGGRRLTVNRAAVKLKRKEEDHLILFSVSSFIETYRAGNTEQHSVPDDVRSPLPTQKSCQHSTGVSVQMYKVAHRFSFWVPNGYKNTEEVAKEDEEEKKQNIKDWTADVENRVTSWSSYSPRSRRASWREMQLEMTRRAADSSQMFEFLQLLAWGGLR